MAEKTIRSLLEKEGLTTLKVSHDWRTGRTAWHGGIEWDASVPWTDYQKAFTFESCLINTPEYIGHKKVLQIFRTYDMNGIREEIEALLKAGRHQGIEFYHASALGITFMNNMHSNVLGVKSGMHAIRAGGIRRHSLNDREMDVIVDGLNLARAMSFKNAAADIPFGGCKCTVHSGEISLDDMERLGFLAYCLDRSRFFTGPDMGFPPELADVFQAHFTRNITGGVKGPLGPTGAPTAYGVYLAIKAAAEHRYGNAQLTDKTILIQGLGAVGYPLAELLLERENCPLLISDINEEAIAHLKTSYGKAAIKTVAPESILDTPADIFAPCAMGGIISKKDIARLKFDIIFGSANNVLAAHSQEEEIALAGDLAARDILYQVEWVHNIAGVMAGYEEYIHQKKADRTRLYANIERVCSMGIAKSLSAAKNIGVTPTAYAYEKVEKKIYPDFPGN